MRTTSLQDSYQDQLALFNLHLYDEFLVLDVIIVLLYMWRLYSQKYFFKQKQSCKLSVSDFTKLYPATLSAHHVVHHICLTFLLLLLIYGNTTLIDCLISWDNFDCSVIHTWWATDKRGVTVPQTQCKNLPENGGKGMWFDSQQPFVGRSVVWRHHWLINNLLYLL